MKYPGRLLQIIREEERPLLFLASRALVLTGLSSLLTIRRDGYTLRFSPSSVAASLWVDARAFSAEETFLLSLVDAGSTIVDVGANVGVLTCALAARCPDVRVISFEPHPRTFQFLRANVELNAFANVMLHNVALGAESGTTSISDRRADDMNHISPSGIQIPVVRLDDVLHDVVVDLLKIDVEGFELNVLRGGQRTLDVTRQIYFEAHEPQYNRFGYGFTDVRTFLEGRGFILERVDPELWTLASLPDDFVPVRCTYLLATRPEP